MEYVSSSIKEVIGRVIRNTRLQDASLIADMDEWIPEAMGHMKTKVTLQPRWKCIPIEFHKGKLPCGMRKLLAVTYGGRRMRYYNGSTVFGAPTVTGTGGSTLDSSIFTAEFFQQFNPANGEGYFNMQQLTQVNQLQAAQEYYYTELNWINTSFQNGYVILFFNAIPVDEEGFPLIPDNEFYKTAIYWYCRAMMIGAGFVDRVFREDQCMQRFEQAAARAVAQIRYPSVDQVESRMENLSRLILPDNYFENFFGPTGKEQMI